MSEQERIAIKEILNEIYVAGDELQTYENLLNKLTELREPDTQQKINNTDGTIQLRKNYINGINL